MADRVVVTGHAGFIGFHVANRLLAGGATVLGIDAVTDYYDPRLKRDRLALLEDQGDLHSREFALEDRDQLVAEITDFAPDVIVHLAAQAGVRYSLEAPATYIDSNLVGTFHVLEAAKAAQPAHLMLASSSSIYGGNSKLPWAETDRADAPISLYAATKKGSEDLAHSYAHLWNIPTTAFRFFTVYGAWGRPDMALFKFVKAALAGESIDVYGNAQMRRDFTYIDDLVDWILRLVPVPPSVGKSVGPSDSISPVAPFRTVNLGGGSPIELMDFIAAIESATGVTLAKRLLPMQPGDVVETYADTSLLQALIGSISSTPVSTGVQSFVDWYRGYVR
ncbi:MAG: NAD-dependent epimerase/dehydratase family protein [Rhodoglobus sp.]